jgi:hypothetical protein
MRAFFNEVGVPSPRVAYVGTASNDDRAFFDSLRNRLRASGAGEVELAPLCGTEADPDAARRILEGRTRSS